jgi:hypothetical protein
LYKVANDNSTTTPSSIQPNNLVKLPVAVSSGDVEPRQSLELRDEKQYESIFPEDTGTSFEPWVSKIDVSPIHAQQEHHDQQHPALLSSMVGQPDITKIKRKMDSNAAATDYQRNIAIQSYRTDVTTGAVTMVNLKRNTETVTTVPYDSQHIIPYTLTPKFPITPPYQQLNDKSLLLKPLTP